MIAMENRIVAFMDVLGFSQMILDYENDKNASILEDFKIAFQTSLDLLETKLGYTINLVKWKEKLEYRTFSDCICVSIVSDIEGIYFNNNLNLFLSFICMFQSLMLQLKRGYLIRGGVSIGSFYADQSMIFSKALIEAYQLESKEAIVPRILISEKIMERVNNETTQITYDTRYSLITNFEDRLSFVNFLNFELFDAVEADKEAERIVKNFGPEGHFINSFEEDSKQRKQELIGNIIPKVQNQLQNSNNRQEVINKYQWLIRFLNREKLTNEFN